MPENDIGEGERNGEGNGNPLQYSCLENPMDGGAWWATVHGVAKSWTWLSDFKIIYLNLHKLIFWAVKECLLQVLNLGSTNYLLAMWNRASSVQFSLSVMFNILWTHRLQHARLPCPSPLLELALTHVYWVCDTIRPSHPLSSPSPHTFLPKSQFFQSGGQTIGASYFCPIKCRQSTQ